MITILTGPPGAGKGTQADLLVERMNFFKLSTGDALRKQIRDGSKMGKIAETYLTNGQLVPDDLIADILKEELDRSVNERVLLDGYPRNRSQVTTLESLKNGKVEAVVNIRVPEDLLVERICGRRVCGECLANYHINFSPPKVAEICDRCGGALKQRSDDSSEKARIRLGVYEKETRPILEYYEGKGICHHIDGAGDKEGVYNKIVGTLSG